jgi:hypothetical protein
LQRRESGLMAVIPDLIRDPCRQHGLRVNPAMTWITGDM